MRAQDLRVEVDTRPETLRYKIREAQLQKIPYMVDHRGPGGGRSHPLAPLAGRHGVEGHPLEAFINRLKEESQIAVHHPIKEKS